MKKPEWNPFVPFYLSGSEGQLLSLLRNRSCGRPHPCRWSSQRGRTSSRDITFAESTWKTRCFRHSEAWKTAAFAGRSHSDPDRPSVANGVRHEVDRSGSTEQQCRAACEGEGFLRFEDPDHGGIEDLPGSEPSSGHTERVSAKRVATIVDGSIVRVGR
jgi:hypothetical protein